MFHFAPPTPNPTGRHPRVLAAVDGAIHTLDQSAGSVEALLAVEGTIVLTGSTQEVREAAARYPHAEHLDLAGRCVVPGFTDSHIHFLGYGLNLERVALTGAASLQVVQQRIREAVHVTPHGEWLLGWGWDHSVWPEAHFPDRTALDEVTSDIPIALHRKDGHLTWTNSAALRAAAITRNTADPPGGVIGRDAAGEPNGLLFETAQDLVHRAIPKVGPARAERAARQAQATLHSLGVTGVHIPEGSVAFGALQSLDAQGALRLRALMMLAYEGLGAALDTGVRTGFGGPFLRLGQVKLFSDGSLGSESAAMLEPFLNSQSAENGGILILPADEIRSAIERAARGGIACAIHAIGDRANRVVLDAFEATQESWRPSGLRQRIEHVQVLHAEDVPRLAQLGVVASVQPIHATQDMDLVDRLWGARGRYAYAFRSLLDSGATLAFGSDAPVETPDPLAGLYAAVTRRRPDGRPEDGWYPEERLTVDEAIRAYTAGAAYAAGQESFSGRLAPGCPADFVVLNQDILSQPAEAILETRVLHTVVDGEIVFSA